MQPPSFTAEELLTTCRPCGVGRVNLIQMSFYRFDNSYILDTRRYPERFVGTAIVDPRLRTRRAMAELRPKGVRAFRIQPLTPASTRRWLEPTATGRCSTVVAIGPGAELPDRP